jgi:hypothetical protein
MSAQTQDFVGGLQQSIRENPVSAALIGMGVLWMFTGGSRITAAAALLPSAARATASGIGSAMQASADAVSAAGDGLRSATSRVADSVRDTVANAASTAGQSASQAYDAVKGAVPDPSAAKGVLDRAGLNDMAGSVQDNLKQTFERQPLLLGAIGLAVGAGMAAAMPRTQIEAEYVGETADKVTARVKDLASTQFEQVAETAGRTFEAVKEEAAAQGLTPQGAKEGAAALGDKIKTVARGVRSKSS